MMEDYSQQSRRIGLHSCTRRGVFSLMTFLALLLIFVVVPAVIAQSPSATPDPNNHNLHHPTATPSPTNAPATADTMSMSGGTMNSTATPDMGNMTNGTPMPGTGNMMDSTSMPGMGNMTNGTPGQGAAGGSNMSMGGHDMSPIDPGNAPIAPPEAKGGQRLEPTLMEGVKEFELKVRKVRWHFLPDVEVVAYTYNGTVPGPEIRVTEGDRVRILVTNELPESTSVHWHGLQIPNEQDGAAGVTQLSIQPGETFTSQWTVPSTPGTFFYHTHFEADRQQTLGLYGALIIEPKQPKATYDVEYTVMLGEWTVKQGKTYPSMDLEMMLPNFFTINGHSFPSTDVVNVKVGQRVLVRFIGSGQFIHPMHLHGQPFKIVATDGNPVPEAAQLTKDTLLIGPGERYDVEFVARAPGKWLLHCHILHHTTNDGQEINGGGGLVMVFNVTP